MPESTDIAFLMLQYIVAMTFSLSAASKLLDPTAFAEVIGSYGTLFEKFVWPISIAIMISEVVIALGLFSGFMLGVILCWALCLVAAIFVVISIMLAIGRSVECGCFLWEKGKLVSWFILLRAGLLGVAIALLWYRVWLVDDNLIPAGIGWALYFEAALAAVLCWTLGTWISTSFQMRKLNIL